MGGEGAAEGVEENGEVGKVYVVVGVEVEEATPVAAFGRCFTGETVLEGREVSQVHDAVTVEVRRRLRANQLRDELVHEPIDLDSVLARRTRAAKVNLHRHQEQHAQNGKTPR